MSIPVREGFIPFRGYRTWYQIHGDLENVPAGKLPAALDEARDRVARRQRRLFQAHVPVTSERRKRRLPMRAMRKRLGQFGSGHATRSSVAIQSAGSQARCFAGSSASSAASE